MGDAASGCRLELTWNRGRTEPYDNGGRDAPLAFTVDDYEASPRIALREIGWHLPRERGHVGLLLH